MPWAPNGFGATTDNRVAGGGGGFTSIPQPPTGPDAELNPPENNLQAGAVALTYNLGGVHFTLVNPGRSA